MKKSFLILIFTLLFLFKAAVSQASQLFSQCFYNMQTQEISGSNIDSMSPIASLSKLMTSLWALSSYGPLHQFKDQVFFQEVGHDLFDVHIQGSRNPFFNNDSLNWLVVQLNRQNIFHIRNLTFDENFIYMHYIEQLGASDAIDFKTRYARTAEAMRTSVNELEKNYPTTRRKFKQRTGEELPQRIALSVESLRRGSFDSSSANSFLLLSAPVVELLGQMNKTSNNHVADFFFETLGGANAFNSFTKNNLNLTEKEIRFINGSGGPYLDKKTQKKFYNYASCRTVVKVILEIQQKLDSENLNLWDIMTAVSPEASKNSKDLNPVNKYYGSVITAHSVVAKTGTINPMIGFAGLVSTNKTRFVIAEFVKTEGSSEWDNARSQILNDLENFITSNEGPKELPVNHKIFLSFSPE